MPDPNIDQLLRTAITETRLIRLHYLNRERIVEPHDYGIQKGVARLLSWQVGGQSSGPLPGWRWFDVGDISEFEVLDRTFPGNRDASGKHHQWDLVFVRVAPPDKRG